MTKSRHETGGSTTPELPAEYRDATPLRKNGEPTSCTSSIEAGFPLSNTVYARSGEAQREITVDPVRIKGSLESLKRNRALQKKGLG